MADPRDEPGRACARKGVQLDSDNNSASLSSKRATGQLPPTTESAELPGCPLPNQIDATENINPPICDGDEAAKVDAQDQASCGNESGPSQVSGSTNHARTRTTPSTGPSRHDTSRPIYGALDLGTNNCRLLLARPSRRGFRVVDAFSRIIRLGEGVSRTGLLSDDAIERAIEALKVCSQKMHRSRVVRSRLVATQACRMASNAGKFLDVVRDEVGLDLEILTQEDEARLAVSGCASLIDIGVDYVLVFDIGGGSSELIWLDLSRRKTGSRTAFVDRLEAQDCMMAWTSLEVGVVTLAEHFGGNTVAPEQFEDMVAYVTKLLEPFEAKHNFRQQTHGKLTHLLGTSGTITTMAGIKLGLKRYDRSKVDGCWLAVKDARKVTDRLLAQTHDERLAEPCIGHERADLVLAGCAILEAMMRTWPSERMRVADRGLREGILASLMSEDGVYRTGRRRGGQRHKSR